MNLSIYTHKTLSKPSSNGEQVLDPLFKVSENAVTEKKVREAHSGFDLQCGKILSDRCIETPRPCALGFDTSILNQTLPEQEVQAYIKRCDKLADIIAHIVMPKKKRPQGQVKGAGNRVNQTDPYLPNLRNKLRSSIESLGIYLMEQGNVSTALKADYVKLVLKILERLFIFPTSDKHDMRNIAFICFSLVLPDFNSREMSEAEELSLQHLMKTFAPKFTEEQRLNMSHIFDINIDLIPDLNRVKIKILQSIFSNSKNFEYQPLKGIYWLK